MRDNKNRTKNHSPEFTDAGEERFSTAPEYIPVGQEFANAAPEFTEPTDPAAYVPEEFPEGSSGETEFSSGKSKHRLLRKAGYLITAAVVAVTLANPDMNPWSGMFNETENTSSWENEMEEPAETVLPTDTEPEMTMQPTTEPEMTAQPTSEPEETVQPTAEPEQEEEAVISYIFSHMPVTAYEVTGLGVGRFESIHDEEVFIEFEDGDDGDGEGYYTNPPYVRLTPGENTFILFCIPGDVELTLYENGGFSTIGAAIHSPSGSSQWEAITYECDMYGPTLEGFAVLPRHDNENYNEETYDGRTDTLVDPLNSWLQFAEIYHPDAQQNDAIYVVEVYGYPDTEIDYLQIDSILAHVIDVFEDHGATAVKEISVEEALERCHVVVSESDEN